jgi:sugar lactone lactonase YvrE
LHIHVFTGSAGALNNELNHPYSIILDRNSNTLYISDFFNHRVMSYAAGATSGIVVAGGNGEGMHRTQLYFPRGLYFDSTSNSLFITSHRGHNVVRWVIGESSWTPVAGSHNAPGFPGCTSELLFRPEGVTFDSMGNMYVADTGNNRIQFFLAGQSNGTTIAGMCASGNSAMQFNEAIALIVDAQFNVYVVDQKNHRVQKFLHY